MAGPETPKSQEAPKEGQEVSKEQLYAILERMDQLAADVKKFDIDGNMPGQVGIRQEEGDFVYRIDVSTYENRSSLIANKDEKKTFGQDKFVGSLVIKGEKLPNGGFRIEMTYQQQDGREMQLRGGGTDRAMGETKRIAVAEYRDGKFTSDNGTLIKEKADKFLKMYSDYVNARKPKIAGPKEVRDF